MTLLEALATFLEEAGVSGPFPLGEIVDLTSNQTLLQHVGSDGDDPTKTTAFPVVQITFRRLNQDDAHEDSWRAYHALNTVRPLALTPSFRVGRSRCPAHPLPLGRDKKLWRVTLDVNFALPYSAVI